MAFGHRDDEGVYRAPWWTGVAAYATLLLGFPAMVAGMATFSELADWDPWVGSVLGLGLVGAAVVTYWEGVEQARDRESRRYRAQVRAPVAQASPNPRTSGWNEAGAEPEDVSRKVAAHDAYLRAIERMRHELAANDTSDESDYQRGRRDALLEVSRSTLEEL